MSGVPIPLSSRVAVPDGGKFAGIRTIVVSMPCCSSTSQNGWPSPQQLHFARSTSGTCHLPTSDVRDAPARCFVVDRYGCIVFGSRWTKSKMPWPPGIEAGDERRPGDRTLRRNRRAEAARSAPRSASRAKFGSRPLRHQLAGQAVVEAVEAEDDDARARSS